MTFAKKITVMALLGALGATVGAVVGEALFLGKGPLRAEPRKVCLLFDVSGSMGDAIVMRRTAKRVISQLEALQQAACDFVTPPGPRRADAMALTVFSSDARIVTQPEPGRRREIGPATSSSLHARGGTNLGRGFDLAREVMADVDGEQRWILLFSDGRPESSSTSEIAGGRCTQRRPSRVRDDGIQIVAIGTGLADENLLTLATGSPQNVIISDPQKLQEAFRRTEEVINRQMLASAGTAVSFKRKRRAHGPVGGAHRHRGGDRPGARSESAPAPAGDQRSSQIDGRSCSAACSPASWPEPPARRSSTR